jgi:hypothetical protein
MSPRKGLCVRSPCGRHQLRDRTGQNRDPTNATGDDARSAPRSRPSQTCRSNRLSEGRRRGRTAAGPRRAPTFSRSRAPARHR